MASLNIVLVGAAGRMGKNLQELIVEDSELNLLAGVDQAGGFFKSLSEVEYKPNTLVIDFSLPSNLQQVSQWCAENKCPLVCGITGLEVEHFKLLDVVAKSSPTFWAPNMSLGIAVFSKLIKQFTSVAEAYDFQIEEVHHKNKVDSPSGTAKFLQQELDNAVAKKSPEPLAIRGGGVFGIHKMWAMTDEEVLTIEHTAISRKVFARGALRAAKWVVSQAPGRYQMSDMIDRVES